MPLEGPSYEPLEQALPQVEETSNDSDLQARVGELRSMLDTQTMQNLATPREQAMLAEVREGETTAVEGLAELTSQMEAMNTIEDNFSMYENYSQFETFLDEGGLSPQEFDNFLASVADEGIAMDMEFVLMESGLPVDRESYVLFADRFGLPTSTTELNTEREETSFLRMQSVADSLRSIPSGISPDLDEFRRMLDSAMDIDPSSAEFRTMRAEIQEFLLGADLESNEGGSIDTILTELRQQDAANVANGNPTRHYELFTRNMRDLSPAVARRIEHFEANFESSSPADGEPASTYQRGVIEAGIPAEAANVTMNGAGEYVASLPDGAQVTVVQDGNHITRSISMDGVDYSLDSPVEAADFSQAHAEYTEVQQTFGSQLQRTENALSYLENPDFTGTPLSDMKDSLLQILGHDLFAELGIREMTDKDALIQKLNENVDIYKDKLEEAKTSYQEKVRQAVARVRERYRENDERLKQTLRTIKYSGLGELGLDYLISQIRGQMIVPDIGAPFDAQELAPEEGNFGETGANKDNPTAHIEYIYRFANKIITGSPDGMVNGQLVGFSLEQAIMYPDVAQKTDSERNAMLAESGVWDEFRGTNKQEMKARLEAPVRQQS